MVTRILIVLITQLSIATAGADDDAVRAAVSKILPTEDAIQISPSALQGVSEVAIGTQVFYVSSDGQFMLGGPMIATHDGDNLTERRVAKARRAILDRTPSSSTYRYPADNLRHRITVVTDIDCPYCRRMHNDMAEYHAVGIDVRYIMLPRAGKGSASYQKTVSAACAKDPEGAITAAMGGATPPNASCDNPIDEHMALARELGVTSTPTIVLEDGRVVLGQRKPADLLALLEAGAR